MITGQTKILSDIEVETFERDGFLVPHYRLPKNKLMLLQELADKLIAENPAIGDEPIASPHIPGSGIQRVKTDPRWLEIPTFPPILDMVEQLIGSDVILWGTTFFHKPPGEQRVVPWHRDGRYWPIKPLATTSVWIAVTETTTENGCLRVIPGSHEARDIGKHYRDNTNKVTIPETLHSDQLEEAQARDIELEAGQMVIFDVYMAHSSSVNESAKRRIGYALRYMPSTSHYDHYDIPIEESRGSAHHTRPLIQVRGIDKSGLNNFTIGHPES
ncbi:MAG: hypothetical protein CFH10_01942 [Alphaproteobacteria bacterium MarineAlpha4_Bin2]|nr:MAG: hypothetical protein CFH10_01942 [Alphaproteobacteria bacterium MarineAlpha4_Bin2]